MATESTEASQPAETTETPDETQRRCRCGRELVRGADTATCIGCGKLEGECACGPND